ncbi:MAG: TonB-dependent receptor [Cyclobacteriaceae bacterium]|nr:TonB-dependent receptor [Cyclobacteriaceae bacterium]
MKKLYKKLSLSLAMMLMLVFVVHAQEKLVTGTVVDENGAGMPGVNVIVRGTAVGSVTDINGAFSLNAKESDVLAFTFVGYKTQDITVGTQTNISVTLAPDLTSLEEIVVTGYSVDTRRSITGAVSTVKTKDLTAVPSGNVEQQLQGRVPGVTVVTNGQPGTTSQIRVRGFGAFGGNAPLYIVDGLPTQSIEFLNPDDIETTTVLKDAATASIYGARAANGVIVYTTKRGSKSGRKMRITYDGLVGVTDPGKGQATMNPTDFADWSWKAVENTATQLGNTPVFNHPQFGTGSSPVIPDYILRGSQFGIVGSLDLNAEKALYNVTDFNKPIYQVTAANKQGTDWYDEITRPAALSRHTIGISGGSEDSRYYIGLSAQDQDGILIHQHFRRYAARVNTEFNIFKNLRIGENLQFTYRQVRLLQGGGGGSGSSDDENDILTAFRMPSIIPVYDVFGGYAGTRAGGFNNPRNPVANLDSQQDNKGFQASGFGNIYLEYDPIKDLTIRTSMGGNYGGAYFWSYGRRQYENSENNSSVTYNEGANQFFGWTVTNTVSYKKAFGNHNLDLLVGQEALNTGYGRSIAGQGFDPFSEDRDFVNLSTTTPGSTRTVNSGSGNGTTFSSYFGRLNYSFNDKYLVSAVIRRDGSSRFGSENKYGTFPAFSAGWRLSEENFLQSAAWLDELKLRGGWGIMGNSNNVDPNNQYSLYATSVGASSYPINNGGAVEGFYRSRIGNPAAKWEKAITKNIGFDAYLFEGKLDVILDLWQKDTEDLLFEVPITVMNGFNAAPPFVNVGKMQNKGIDLQVITRGNFTPDVRYEFTINGGFLKNEIVELNEGATYLSSADADPSFRGIRPIRNQLGHSISSFFGYEVSGLFQSVEEVAAAPTQAGAAPGRFRYNDINGDGVINTDDRTFLGSPVPKFTGGINFKISYKNFELESYMFASIGNKIWNQSKWFTDFYPSFAGAAISERVKDSWSFTGNKGGDIPIFENVSNFSTNTQANSFYVEDGSYFRMQNITLGYNLPEATLSKLNLAKLRIFASTNNVFTITGYDGLDPSVGGDVDTRFGIDVGNFPITRSWTFGVNLGF